MNVHKILGCIADLQFSTDDEEFEEVVGEFESVAATLGQGEALARSAQPVHYLPGAHGEDESKQAAEAMVQLSSAAYYNQPDQGGKNTLCISFRFKLIVIIILSISFQTNQWTWIRITIRPIS